MHITINIDTDNELTDADRTVLLALATTPEPATVAKPVVKATPKKAAAAKPEPEPEADEDVLGGGKPTISDAIARATELVSSGQTAKVKAALGEVGAKRVSELTDKTLEAFLSALDAQD